MCIKPPAIINISTQNPSSFIDTGPTISKSSCFSSAFRIGEDGVKMSDFRNFIRDNEVHDSERKAITVRGSGTTSGRQDFASEGHNSSLDDGYGSETSRSCLSSGGVDANRGNMEISKTSISLDSVDVTGDELSARCNHSIPEGPSVNTDSGSDNYQDDKFRKRKSIHVELENLLKGQVERMQGKSATLPAKIANSSNTLQISNTQTLPSKHQDSLRSNQSVLMNDDMNERYSNSPENFRIVNNLDEELSLNANANFNMNNADYLLSSHQFERESSLLSDFRSTVNVESEQITDNTQMLNNFQSPQSSLASRFGYSQDDVADTYESEYELSTGNNMMRSTSPQEIGNVMLSSNPQNENGSSDMLQYASSHFNGSIEMVQSESMEMLHSEPYNRLDNRSIGLLHVDYENSDDCSRKYDNGEDEKPFSNSYQYDSMLVSNNQFIENNHNGVSSGEDSHSNIAKSDSSIYDAFPSGNYTDAPICYEHNDATVDSKYEKIPEKDDMVTDETPIDRAAVMAMLNFHLRNKADSVSNTSKHRPLLSTQLGKSANNRTKEKSEAEDDGYVNNVNSTLFNDAANDTEISLDHQNMNILTSSDDPRDISENFLKTQSDYKMNEQLKIFTESNRSNLDNENILNSSNTFHYHQPVTQESMSFVEEKHSDIKNNEFQLTESEIAYIRGECSQTNEKEAKRNVKETFGEVSERNSTGIRICTRNINNYMHADKSSAQNQNAYFQNGNFDNDNEKENVNRKMNDTNMNFHANRRKPLPFGKLSAPESASVTDFSKIKLVSNNKRMNGCKTAGWIGDKFGKEHVGFKKNMVAHVETQTDMYSMGHKGYACKIIQRNTYPLTRGSFTYIDIALDESDLLRTCKNQKGLMNTYKENRVSSLTLGHKHSGKYSRNNSTQRKFVDSKVSLLYEPTEMEDDKSAKSTYKGSHLSSSVSHWQKDKKRQNKFLPSEETIGQTTTQNHSMSNFTSDCIENEDHSFERPASHGHKISEASNSKMKAVVSPEGSQPVYPPYNDFKEAISKIDDILKRDTVADVQFENVVDAENTNDGYPVNSWRQQRASKQVGKIKIPDMFQSVSHSSFAKNKALAKKPSSDASRENAAPTLLKSPLSSISKAIGRSLKMLMSPKPKLKKAISVDSHPSTKMNDIIIRRNTMNSFGAWMMEKDNTINRKSSSRNETVGFGDDIGAAFISNNEWLKIQDSGSPNVIDEFDMNNVYPGRGAVPYEDLNQYSIMRENKTTKVGKMVLPNTIVEEVSNSSTHKLFSSELNGGVAVGSEEMEHMRKLASEAAFNSFDINRDYLQNN